MNTKMRSRGQSLLEFSIILPVAFFLITGFLDMGRAIFYYSSLTNAVREATRYAIVHKDEIEEADANNYDNSLQDKVLEFAFGLTGPVNPLERDDIGVFPVKDGNYFTTITITAVYTFDPITPGINLLLSPADGFDLNAQSTMFITPAAR